VRLQEERTSDGARPREVGTVKLSLHIEAPVEKVFAYFKDPANWQELQEGITFEDVRPTPEGVGTSYRWTARMAGLPVRGTNVFTEFVPDQRIVDESSLSLEGTWIYTFEPEGSGTRLTLENRNRSFWRVPPLSRLLDQATARGHARVMERAKARMEA
jgi:hypothetical protein